jgi:hypothetical protein
MWPQADAMGAGKACHARDISLQRRQVQYQGGRVEAMAAAWLADQGSVWIHRGDHD